MSYYWAIPGPSPAPTTLFAMGSQSSLHRERAYLLSALAAEESRGEQLTFSLDAARQRLAAADRATNSVDDVKKLKKAVTSIARKLKRSQKCRKAMVNNLAAVTSRMTMLEQHQWRRAQFEYNRRTQLPSFDDTTMTMQNLTLASPITPDYHYRMQSPISPQMLGLVYPVPLSPLPNIQWGVTSGGDWGSSLYIPFYAQPYGCPQASSQRLLQPTQHPSPIEGPLWRNVEYSRFPGQAIDPRHQRTMSLPTVQRRASWARKGPWESSGEDEAASPMSGINPARRLSLVGEACVGLRLANGGSRVAEEY
jgi:hypothetical protein